VKKKPAVKILTPVEIVDEFVRLSAETSLLDPKFARLAVLEKLILAFPEVVTAAKDATVMVEGNAGAVSVSACRKQRAITDMPGLIKKLSQPVFLSRATITLGNVDALIPDEKERAKFVTETQDGKRTVKPLEKAAA
jgi:hypothetical protein